MVESEVWMPILIKKVICTREKADVFKINGDEGDDDGSGDYDNDVHLLDTLIGLYSTQNQ